MEMTRVSIGNSYRAGVSSFQPSAFLSMASAPRMGQYDQTWYERAKAALAKYEELVSNTSVLNEPAVREDLISRYSGDLLQADSVATLINILAQEVQEAESYVPTRYEVFADRERQGRVEKLEYYNRLFESDIAKAKHQEPYEVQRVEAKDNTIAVVALVGGLVLVGILALTEL